MSLINKIDSYAKTKYYKPAHVFEGNIMTYGELKEKSDALACYLIDTYKNNKPIIVYGHKQNEMLICFLACVKSGHAYVPVDSYFPMERLKSIIQGANADFIFNIAGYDFDFTLNNTLSLNDINSILKEYKGRTLDESHYVKNDETYYIIYTSGSTGNPKGVQIPISCLESFVAWGTSLCKNTIDDNTVFMNQAPFSFDLSVMDLYLSLSNGCTLFSISKESIANMKTLFDNFKDSNISIWVSTPSFAEMCLVDSSFNSNLLPNLKEFLFCGEVLTNSCAARLKERFKDSRVINTYGPTEATVAITSVEVDDEINKISPLPVGKVKSDCKIFIMDEEGKEVPEGEKGEVVIVGDSVSTGYYNNKAITDKSFGIMNLNGLKKRFYKTGDEGYIKNDMLYYNGRMDFQVKLNGYRIELEDIENNLRKIDFIKNAIVLPVQKEGKIQYLAGVVILNTKFEKRDFEIAMLIKNELKSVLPEYMVPRKFIFKETFPMTINGKVDRKILAEEIL